jgi:hypothetical protein
LLILRTIAAGQLRPIAGAEFVWRRLNRGAGIGAPVVFGIARRRGGELAPGRRHGVDFDSDVETIDDADVIEIGVTATLAERDLAKAGRFGVKRTGARAIDCADAAGLTVARVAAGGVFGTVAGFWSGATTVGLACRRAGVVIELAHTAGELAIGAGPEFDARRIVLEADRIGAFAIDTILARWALRARTATRARRKFPSAQDFSGVAQVLCAGPDGGAAVVKEINRTETRRTRRRRRRTTEFKGRWRCQAFGIAVSPTSLKQQPSDRQQRQQDPFDLVHATPFFANPVWPWLD